MDDVTRDPEAIRWRNGAVRQAARIVRDYFGEDARFCAEDILKLLVPEPAPGDPSGPAPSPDAPGTNG